MQQVPVLQQQQESQDHQGVQLSLHGQQQQDSQGPQAIQQHEQQQILEPEGQYLQQQPAAISGAAANNKPEAAVKLPAAAGGDDSSVPALGERVKQLPVAQSVERAAASADYPSHNPKLDPTLLRQQQQQLADSAAEQLSQGGPDLAAGSAANVQKLHLESGDKIPEHRADNVERGPGRDLKQEPETETETELELEQEEEEKKEKIREKRDLTPVLCENDPLCAAKFDRNPLADSGLLDRGDPGRFLSLGDGGLRRRSLLALAEGTEGDEEGGSPFGSGNGTRKAVRTSLGPPAGGRL
jgi:hypothetical protein